MKIINLKGFEIFVLFILIGLITLNNLEKKFLRVIFLKKTDFKMMKSIV